jgi:prolyl 4-hydroxylase
MDELLCDHFMNVAGPRLAPSGVVDPVTGTALRSEKRTSYSMYYQASMYDAIVARGLKQIAAVAGLPPQHAEPLGVLRYGLGQEYRPHYDYYSDSQHEAQRVATVFVYLNEVEEGGGTEFPRLGVTVQPARGKAVKFLNCDAAGRPNPETLHAGLPVIRGEKWLATLWFWDRPFHWFAA